MADYRALLRDRRAKATRQHVTHDFCLNPELIGELAELEAARDEEARPYTQRIAEARRQGAGRMVAPDTAPIEAERDAALAELDAQIDAKKTEIRDASLILHFRAVKPDIYLDLVNTYDPDGETAGKDARRAQWMDALVAASFVKATGVDGEPTDLTWAEIVDSVSSWGESDMLRSKVFAANKLGVDVPFSLSTSGKTRRAAKK